MTEFPANDQNDGRFPDDEDGRRRYAASVYRHHQKRRLTPAERETIMVNIRQHNPVLAGLLEQLHCQHHNKNRPK